MPLPMDANHPLCSAQWIAAIQAIQLCLSVWNGRRIEKMRGEQMVVEGRRVSAKRRGVAARKAVK